MSLAKKTLAGLSWTTSATFVNVALQIGYTSWISKILSPKEFGLMALAMVVLNFGAHFSKMGIGQALVQKEELHTSDIRAAFTLSMLFSILIFAIIYFLSPFIASYFDSKILVEILQLMGLSLVISGFSIVSGNLLRREMKFKQVSLVNIASFVLSYPVLGIILALSGWGVWSLVYAALFQVLFNALVQYALKPHNVVPTFKAAHFTPILSYGGKISLNGILSYTTGNLENIFIARYLNTSSLGYYNRARLLVFLPAYHLHSSLSSVLFPAFSKLQNQREKLKNIYFNTVALSSSILIPVCLGMSVAATECVLVVLGEKWTPSIPIFQVLCFVVPFNLLSSYAGIVCDAVNKIKPKIQLNVFIIFFMASGFYLMRNQGIFGFLIILLLRDVIKTMYLTYIMKSVFSTSFSYFLKPYVAGIYHGLITMAGIYGITLVCHFFSMPHIVTLLLQMLTGGMLLMSQLIFIPHTYLKFPIHYTLTKFNLKKLKLGKFNLLLNKYMIYLESSFKPVESK